MKQERIIMSMPTIIEITDHDVNQAHFTEVFDYLSKIEERFSPFKETSEVSLYNAGKILEKDLSNDFKEILKLSGDTKNDTNGFFDIEYNGKINPSGLVKGWAIEKASEMLSKSGYQNFYIEIAGDMDIRGLNSDGEKWVIGIRNPFNKKENVKILYLTDCGIATSGNYEKGKHIYNPMKKVSADEIASLTVIGPNVYDADRYATAVFAMGREGINFIEKLDGFEGYMIDNRGIATFTSGFEKYLVK